MNNEDTLRPEYPSELIKSGIRGKYGSRYQLVGWGEVQNPTFQANYFNSSHALRLVIIRLGVSKEYTMNAYIYCI
jgi:hypothetical protein